MARTVSLVMIAALALGAPLPALAVGSTAERILDLSPERLAAFKQAMRDIGGILTAEEAASEGLFLQSSYGDGGLLEYEPPAREAPMDEIIVPPSVMGRDLWHDEAFLMQGREDDFEDAARKWLVRRVKGSDAAAASRGGAFGAKFAWNDGPLLGFRQGPISALVGEHSWSVRVSRPIRSLPGWVARLSVGAKDGDTVVEFKVGRSLFRALR